MKLKTEDLRARVDGVLDQLAEMANAADAKVEEQKAAQLAEWREKSAPVLAERLRALATKAKRGTPVRDEDLQRVYRVEPYLGSPSLLFREQYRQADRPRPGQVADLQALKAFLSTVTDETVTTSALTSAGFRNLASILRST